MMLSESIRSWHTLYFYAASWSTLPMMKNHCKRNKITVKHLELSYEVLETGQSVIRLTKLTLVLWYQRLLGICGSVGSGKSSLISALLGQLRIKRGSLGIGGKLAYVPQQAWIFHDSVRENILFGMSWNERKYNRGETFFLRQFNCEIISPRWFYSLTQSSVSKIAPTYKDVLID